VRQISQHSRMRVGSGYRSAQSYRVRSAVSYRTIANAAASSPQCIRNALIVRVTPDPTSLSLTLTVRNIVSVDCHP
jgi:hypothetical protein